MDDYPIFVLREIKINNRKDNKTGFFFNTPWNDFLNSDLQRL